MRFNERDQSLTQLALPFSENGSGRSVERGSEESAVRGPYTRVADSKTTRVECLQCREELEIPDWFQKAELGVRICSSACRTAWANAELNTATSIQLGASVRKRGANWAEQTNKARQRDSYTCQLCGVSEEELGRRLHVHHKIPFRHFRTNVEANKLEHLVSLCPSCHGQLERQLRRELPLFAHR